MNLGIYKVQREFCELHWSLKLRFRYVNLCSDIGACSLYKVQFWLITIEEEKSNIQPNMSVCMCVCMSVFFSLCPITHSSFFMA